MSAAEEGREDRRILQRRFLMPRWRHPQIVPAWCSTMARVWLCRKPRAAILPPAGSASWFHLDQQAVGWRKARDRAWKTGETPLLYVSQGKQAPDAEKIPSFLRSRFVRPGREAKYRSHP